MLDVGWRHGMVDADARGGVAAGADADELAGVYGDQPAVGEQPGYLCA
jgi:hypothetical protein